MRRREFLTKTAAGIALPSPFELTKVKVNGPAAAHLSESTGTAGSPTSAGWSENWDVSESKPLVFNMGLSNSLNSDE